MNIIYANNENVMDVRADVAEMADSAEEATYQVRAHPDFEEADRAFYEAVVAEIKRRQNWKLFKKWRQKNEGKEGALVMLRRGAFVSLVLCNEEWKIQALQSCLMMPDQGNWRLATDKWDGHWQLATGNWQVGRGNTGTWGRIRALAHMPKPVDQATMVAVGSFISRKLPTTSSSRVYPFKR